MLGRYRKRGHLPLQVGEPPDMTNPPLFVECSDRFGPDRLPAGHPMAAHLEVYHWLTVLQEHLVLGLMGKPIR